MTYGRQPPLPHRGIAEFALELEVTLLAREAAPDLRFCMEKGRKSESTANTTKKHILDSPSMEEQQSQRHFQHLHSLSS